MGNISDGEIRQIVQRVLSQALGLSNPSTGCGNATIQADPTSKGESKTPMRKSVAIGSDHGGFELKEILKTDIAKMDFDIIDAGTNSKEPVDYPDFAHNVAKLVSAGKAWRGIVIDGAGIGSCIVANKVPGIRAGMAYDHSTAINSREHNDTNVLSLGAGLIGVSLARQIVQTWLSTSFSGGRHAPRVDKIVAIEKQYLK